MSCREIISSLRLLRQRRFLDYASTKHIQTCVVRSTDSALCPPLVMTHQRWARIRTEANFGRIRTRSDCNVFEIWRIRTGWNWKNFFCFNENRSTIYSYFDFGLKNSSFRLPHQRPSSSADCARELFNGSNGSASLVDCTRKKILGWRVRIFCDWRHKWSSFGVILAHVAWPWAQLLGQSLSLKFSLETRLESKSFEPLIDFLAFWFKSYDLK